MNDNFTENLFQSIDTIVNARLANLPYDQTIECEIINADENLEGRYLVRYQASTFIALSSNSTYKVGDIVYVQIPRRDFTLDKFIINKKVNNEVRKTKKLPFLTFAKNLNLSSAVLQNKQFIIKTTGDGVQTELDGHIFSSFYDEVYAAGYTRLGLKASIKLNIPNEVSSGNYGIKLVLTGFDQNSTYLPATEMVGNFETKEFILSLKDMISSNYYNTPGYYNQEKVFDIENFVIKTIKVVFWQDGNFLTNDAQQVNGAKIYFTNLSLFLGYDTEEFRTSNTRAFLYTNSGYKYNNDYLIKPIYLRFAKLNKNNNLEIITAALESYAIYWEEYDPNIKTNGPQSNIISFRNLESNNIGGTSKKVTFEEGQGRLRYSYVCVVIDLLGNKFISNRLDFIRDTYLKETELIDLLTSFFRIDDNNRVYLNGGANNDPNGLNISNIILNDIFIANQSRFKISDSFTITDSSGNSLITIAKTGITINVPVTKNE